MYLHTILSGILHIIKTAPHIMRKVLYIIFNLHIRQSRRSIETPFLMLWKARPCGRSASMPSHKQMHQTFQLCLFPSWIYITRHEFCSPHRERTTAENPQRSTVPTLLHGGCYLKYTEIHRVTDLNSPCSMVWIK